jgi:hypothetical protein
MAETAIDGSRRGCSQRNCRVRLSLTIRVTMLRLTERRRAMLVEKVPDLANLILASTFLGQFLTDRPFSALLAVVGFVIWAGLAVLAFEVADHD